jgi:hypothetical protein
LPFAAFVLLPPPGCPSTLPGTWTSYP